jgi:hypothetical protein
VDWVINDSKYLKLREISLSYDADERYLRYAGARGGTFTIAARNLHTWTPYTGLDPENMFLGATLSSPQFLDQANLPQLTSFVLTVHLSY